MPQPPPRKVKPTAALKSLHSEQITKLQAKHQQECDLLEDIRWHLIKVSLYFQGLQKLTAQLLKRDFQAMPDLTSDDGREHRTAMHVWRVILEETDAIAKKRLHAAETYLERIAEPVKLLKTNKVQCMKRIQPLLTTMHGEMSQSLLDMTKAHKTYTVDETQSHDARLKAAEAGDKLNKKTTGMFQSLAGLQKNHAKLEGRREICETKSTASRNEYILCTAAANAHQVRYFTTDLPDLLEVLDGEIFEHIQEYFSIYGGTAQDVSNTEMRCYDKVIEEANLINRNFDLKCFLYTNPVFTEQVQYEFEPCLNDECNKINKDYNASHDLDKEARKWATKIAKENKAIRGYQRALKILGAGDKISESGSSEVSGLDPEIKSDELLQNIRKAETARAKAEARIESLRSAGVNVDEWLASANVDSLGLDEEVQLHRAPSRTSIKTDSSEHTDDQEPTYTHYDEDDDFMDDTFEVSVCDYSLKNSSYGRHYPVKCRSIYDFYASNVDELNMGENEELEIIADGDGDGWVKAKKSNGDVGLIPENYIVLVEGGSSETGNRVTVEDNNIAQQPSPVDTGVTVTAVTSTDDVDEPDFPSPPPEMMTNYSSQPPQEEESAETIQSPMSPADTKQEVTSYSSGDIEVQLTTSMMVNEMQLPVGEGIWVRALYDYEGTTEDELSFTEGTLIKIVRKDENGIDDGFWEGEINGRVGVFPSLVVEELESANDATEFPSPLKSPPDFMPPPPVMVTEATPETEYPPSPIANGTATMQDQANEEVLDQYKKKVRFGTSYNSYDVLYDRPTYIEDDYDSQYDDDGEESIV